VKSLKALVPKGDSAGMPSSNCEVPLNMDKSFQSWSLTDMFLESISRRRGLDAARRRSGRQLGASRGRLVRLRAADVSMEGFPVLADVLARSGNSEAPVAYREPCNGGMDSHGGRRSRAGGQVEFEWSSGFKDSEPTGEV
jgi:hypothetical protein